MNSEMLFGFGDMLIAIGMGGLVASTVILALCKSAGDADQWLSTHQPTDPCSDFATEAQSTEESRIQSPTPTVSRSENSVSLWQVNPPLRKV